MLNKINKLSLKIMSRPLKDFIQKVNGQDFPGVFSFLIFFFFEQFLPFPKRLPLYASTSPAPSGVQTIKFLKSLTVTTDERQSGRVLGATITWPTAHYQVLLILRVRIVTVITSASWLRRAEYGKPTRVLESSNMLKWNTFVMKLVLRVRIIN